MIELLSIKISEFIHSLVNQYGAGSNDELGLRSSNDVDGENIDINIVCTTIIIYLLFLFFSFLFIHILAILL